MLRVPVRRCIRGAVFLQALFFLTACGDVLAGLRTPFEAQRSLERAEWAFVPRQDAWVNLPGATLVVERRFADVIEQRTALPNNTTLRGDNFAHLRAVPDSDRSILMLDRAIARAGGLPTPFSQVELNSMRSREDAAGTLNWSEWTDGAGTACVLVIRRMSIGVRVLPHNAIALDMVMRNCVRGEPADALVPSLPQAVVFGAPSGVERGGQQRTLSPLAAPLP